MIEIKCFDVTARPGKPHGMIARPVATQKQIAVAGVKF